MITAFNSTHNNNNIQLDPPSKPVDHKRRFKHRWLQFLRKRDFEAARHLSQSSYSPFWPKWESDCCQNVVVAANLTRRQKKPGMPPTPAAFSAPPGKRAFPHNSLPMRLAIFSLGEQSLSFLEETIFRSWLIIQSIIKVFVPWRLVYGGWEPKDLTSPNISRLLGFPFLGNPSVWCLRDPLPI